MQAHVQGQREVPRPPQRPHSCVPLSLALVDHIAQDKADPDSLVPPSCPSLSSSPSRRTDLRHLGQTTKVVKSTLNDVRQKIAELRAKSAASADAKKYDFEQRIKDIKQAEVASRDEAREAKRRKRDEERAQAEKDRTKGADEQMMQMMGFGGFGGPTKR